MKNINNINLLDCTLRDGGYYNNWKFSNNLVTSYVENINKSKINYVEIGFRFLIKNTDYGLHAFCPSNLINRLKFKKNVNKAIMINGSDFIKINNDLTILKNLFPTGEEKQIKLLRIALHFNELENIAESLNYLQQRYNIAINLMQISNFSSSDLKFFFKKLKKIIKPKVFYFADSLGNLDNQSVAEYCKIIKNEWEKDFGIHAHDNCGMALSNTLTAIENGAKWADSTISGMGRGAGNASTEMLAPILDKKKLIKLNTQPLFLLCEEYFENLKKKYKWGPSIFYLKSAINKIHPTFIQELLSDKRYNTKELINILDNLAKNKDHQKFDNNILRKYTKSSNNQKWYAKDWSKNKNIIIIGQGKSAISQFDRIKKIKKETNGIIITINFNKKFDKIADYILVCEKKRFILDNIYYRNKNVIIPKNIFNKRFKKDKNINLFNYEVNFTNNFIKINETSCSIINNFSLGYALAICFIGNAKRINLAGFDGYSIKEMNTENKNKFNLYLKKYKFKINFLTKSYLNT